MLKAFINWLSSFRFSQKNYCEDKDIKDSKLFDKLMNFKMQDLRKLGKNYGALHTKKSELVEEILEKVPKDKIIKFTKR